MADQNASEVNSQGVQEPSQGTAVPQDAIQAGLLEMASGAQGNATQELPQGTAGQGNPANSQPETLTRQQAEEMLEQQRRAWQSQKDRELHQAQMRWQQEQERLRRDAEERARLDGMDDEDFGRFVREQQQKQQELAEITRSSVTQSMLTVQQQTLDQIPDADVREQIINGINEGKYQNWGELQKALLDAVTEKRVAKTRAELEQSIREAVQRELTAQLADTPTPSLGTGLPTKSAQYLSTDDLLSQGYAERVASQRRGR